MNPECPYCSRNMAYLGRIPFRVGGSTGGMGMLLGSWNQLSERTETFDLYRCENCGKVDFFTPPSESGREAQGSQSPGSTVSEEQGGGERKHHRLFG